jgi:hypothetical protein
MRAKEILHQIELDFWDAFIPLMNKSAYLRFILPRLYRIFHSKEFQNTVKTTLLLSILGLILGFLFGVLHPF